jgi:hypothetical protein
MTIPYIKTDTGLTAIVNGQAFTITDDNASFRQVFDAIVNGESEDTVEELFNQALAIRRYMGGESNGITVEGGTVYYNGEEVHNVVADRIVEFMSNDLPCEPLVKFLERLLANPSRRATKELYTFLQHKSLPITDDGHFLAYKGVRDDYTDVYSGKFTNQPGSVNEMPRQAVDDDFRVGCSYGFHVGSLEYATTFGNRTVIVKVDPADVVSVPEDCECQKVRTAKYEVVCDYAGALTRPLADASSPYVDEDNRWDDEDDDDLDEYGNTDQYGY